MMPWYWVLPPPIGYFRSSDHPTQVAILGDAPRFLIRRSHYDPIWLHKIFYSASLLHKLWVRNNNGTFVSQLKKLFYSIACPHRNRTFHDNNLLIYTT